MKFNNRISVVLLLVAICLWTDGYACKVSCFDCKNKGKCEADANGAMKLVKGDECGEKQACKMLGPNPVCSPIADTNCNCGGKPRGCDPFDDSKPLFCFSDDIILATACSTDGSKTCSADGLCVTAEIPQIEDLDMACTDPAAIGYVVAGDACTSGVFCNAGKGSNEIKCNGTDYFDIVSVSCKSLPPPLSCDCGKTKCPVSYDCAKYLVCADGKSDEETCPANSFFNPATMECDLSAEEGICASYKDCEIPEVTPATPSTDTTTPTVTTPPPGASPTPPSGAGSSPPPSGAGSTPPPSGAGPSSPTTTKPSTTKPSTCNASNVNKRYPHESECKKYYTCRLVSRNTYDYVPSKCVGNLVFNPANGYCDLPENVPTCPK